MASPLEAHAQYVEFRFAQFHKLPFVEKIKNGAPRNFSQNK